MGSTPPTPPGIMKLLVIAFAGLAGSVAAQPFGRVRRNTEEVVAIADRTGAHYNTAYLKAHALYEAKKKEAGELLADSNRYFKIAKANEEAYKAYDTQVAKKKEWDEHVADRKGDFTTHEAPKHATYKEKNDNYIKNIKAKDNLITAENALHTQNNVPLTKRVADEDAKIKKSKAGVAVFEENIEEEKTKQTKANAAKELAQGELDTELTRHTAAIKKLVDEKATLKTNHEAWNKTHEETWAETNRNWHVARDAAEKTLKTTHESQFQTWLDEKLGADVANDHCPCGDHGSCDELDTFDVELFGCTCDDGWEGTTCDIQETPKPDPL